MGYLNVGLGAAGLIATALQMWPLATTLWAASSMLQTIRIIKYQRKHGASF